MNYLAYQNRDILFSLSIKTGQSQSDIFDVAFLSTEVVACASNESAEQQKNVTFQPNKTTATQSKILRRASFRSSRSHQTFRQRKHALPVKFIVSHKKETLVQFSTGFLQSVESLTIVKKTNRYSSTNFLLQLQRVFYSSNLVRLLLRCSRQLRKQLRSELLSNYEEPHWN